MPITGFANTFKDVKIEDISNKMIDQKGERSDSIAPDTSENILQNKENVEAIIEEKEVQELEKSDSILQKNLAQE